jgi:sigma-B regulation protein RsbU (phosphoserine phosphatase)
LLALALLGNAIRDYLFVSRLLAIQQVRRQMRQTVNGLEQQLRKSWKPGDSRLKLLVEAFETSGEKPLWLEIRTPENTSIERYGDKPGSTFASEEETESLRSHESLYRVVKARHGETVVEVFPLHLPPIASPPGSSEPPRPSGGPPGPRSLLLVEVAMPLTPGDATLLKAQRWNLAISCSVAIALLATVLIAALSIRRYVRGRLLEQQVEIAREVQARLLPQSASTFPGVRVATEYRPSEQVGGDLYDAFATPEGKVAFVVGDVSGKGLPAALLMGVIHGAVRSSRWTQSPELHEAECANLNRLLCESASGERYATLFWCYCEPAARTLHYINAGHCAPLILTRRNGAPELLALDRGGPVVGILRDAPYTQASVELVPGDTLVMFSDGLVEATRSGEEEFGDRRLRTLLAGLGGEPAETVRARILDSIQSFMGSARLHDDLTLVVAVFGEPQTRNRIASP